MTNENANPSVPSSTLAPERPVVLPEKESLRAFVRQVADRLAQLDVSGRGQVVALYGGRGTGKTSALLTLLDLLRGENSQRDKLSEKDRFQKIEWFIPPQRAGESVASPRQLFAPEYSRADDDLLFLLIDYLADRYAAQLLQANKLLTRQKVSPLGLIRAAEVRRRMPEQFFEFEKDASVSSRELPRRLVRSQSRVAQTTRKIHEQFRSLFGLLTAPAKSEGAKPGRLVLLIDDLDLQPQWALELLELLHLFLLHPQVIVVLAADQEQLLHNITVSLQNRESQKHGTSTEDLSHFESLARALLRKWVPIEFPLPRPAPRDRWTFHPLSEGEKRIDERIVELFWTPAPARFRLESELQNTAQELVTPLLPDVYRNLVYLSNRLRIFDREGTQWNEQLAQDLGLESDLLKPFLSLLICADVTHPELRLLGLAREFPWQLASELSAWVALPPNGYAEF